MSDTTSEFPVERAFLELTQELADASSKGTDKFCAEAGKSLPQTMDATGTVLSVLYRLACCYYGCRGGDHQIEWLVGKFVNQALSTHRLVRAAQYDEALMLIRGKFVVIVLRGHYLSGAAQSCGARMACQASPWLPNSAFMNVNWRGVRPPIGVISD